MKKQLFVFCLIVLSACKSKTPKNDILVEKRYVTVEVAAVNVLKKNRAYELGKRLLETCNTSRFKAFTTAEATDKVIKNASVENISKTCQKMNMRNGKFVNLKLIDIVHDLQTDAYVFRYDIIYEKKYFKREMKVTIDNANKISGITTKEIATKPF